MKKFFLFKLLTLAIMLFVIILPSFAKNESTYNLKKVIIEKSSDDFHKINLIFDYKYQGNAFFQTRGNGIHYIYLPDTSVNAKKAKIIYRNNKDKKNITVNLEEKPFITENNDSKYVRVTVTANDTAPLKIVSNTVDETKNNFMYYIAGIVRILALALILCIIVPICIYMYKLKKKALGNSGYSMNRSYNNEFLTSIIDKNENTNEFTHIPDYNISSTLKPASNEAFTCFDITGDINSKTNPNNYNEFNKNLNKEIRIFSSKRNLKQTNPISKSAKKSELQIPVVEDLKNTESIKEKRNEAELISVLNINSKVGFYLTNVGETLALFGFVGENVFLFKKFSDLSQINLQARFYDKHGQNDLYIVRLDSYRAMIEISENDMKELAVL